MSLSVSWKSSFSVFALAILASLKITRHKRAHEDKVPPLDAIPMLSARATRRHPVWSNGARSQVAKRHCLISVALSLDRRSTGRFCCDVDGCCRSEQPGRAPAKPPLLHGLPTTTLRASRVRLP